METILKRVGAWHEGHTSFYDGRHGNGWIEKNLIVRNSNYLDEVAKLHAEKIKENFPEVTMLLGPVTGGALIASHVGKYIGKDYGVIMAKQEPIVYHDMLVPGKEDRVVLVEDIISSGVDMGRFAGFVISSGANLIGISVWMNRREDTLKGVKVVSLIENPFKVFDKENCPLCAFRQKIEFENVRE